MFVAMKMKYVLDPMFCMAIGQNCVTIMEPIEPALAVMQRPLARRCCGKI
jgi:hypothetical protein